MKKENYMTSPKLCRRQRRKIARGISNEKKKKFHSVVPL